MAKGQVLARKHGGKGTPEYKIWDGIKQRCYNPKSTEFKNYGGRGIAMHDEWRRSFPAFLRDVGLRPAGRTPSGKRAMYTLDRKDNAKGYEPDNVRWVTYSTQIRNTRHNVMATIDGRTQCLAAWCEERGLNYNTVRARVFHGWTPEDAVLGRRRS